MLLPCRPYLKKATQPYCHPRWSKQASAGKKKPARLSSFPGSCPFSFATSERTALQSVPALSKPRQPHHPNSHHVKYSSLRRTRRDLCGPENKRVAEQKCVNNSLLDALKISPNSKRLKKPHTHKPQTSALLSSQPGQFHSAAWLFCTNIFTVPKWKRQTSAWFSYKWFWKQMRTIWKAFSLNVSSVNWTCKCELAPLNFRVSFWEERVMKAYQFLIGSQLVI